MFNRLGDSWFFNAEGMSEADQEKLNSFDKLLNLPVTIVSQDSKSNMGHCQLDKTYYLKTYFSSGSWLRELIGYGRFDVECRNLNFFQTLSIPTTKVIAIGKQTQGFRLEKGVILTEGLSNCITLLDLANRNRLYERGRPWLRKVLDQVASHARKLHDNGFFHVDLKWRNILVSDDEEGCVYFIDCPSGYFPPKVIMPLSIKKDLACLDKGADPYLKTTDQLYFYKSYFGIGKLDTEHKRYIQKIKKHFDEHGNRQRPFRKRRGPDSPAKNR